MLKRSYVLLVLFISHIVSFAQSDQALCDQFSIKVIEENQCIPGASFTFGINGYSDDDFVWPLDEKPFYDSVDDFVWSTSPNVLNYQLAFNEDSTEITIKSLFDTNIRKVYLDINLSDDKTCQYAIDLQATRSSTLYPKETNTNPANESDSINIDFTKAGDRCSIFNFTPKSFNNDSLQNTYIYEWAVMGPDDRKITALGLNQSRYFALELEGSYDLYVKVIKPIECGNAFVYRDSLIEDFVNINGNMELESELDFLCLEPETKYPIFINDFSPIIDRVDTANAGFSWTIYRKRHNLRGSGIAYSFINNEIPTRSNSSKDSTSYQFTEAGDYLVIYNIDIADGCTYSDQHTFNIGVYPQYIYPKIENSYKEVDYLPTLCSGKSDVYFPFTSTSYLDLDYKSKYNWYSSSSTVVIENPKQRKTDIAFRDEGEFELTLRVENNYGCVDSISRTIHVKNAKPDDQDLKVSSSVTENESIQLTIDSIEIDTGYYFQLDRWDAYFGWIEDYSRTDSLHFTDQNVGVSSDLYEYQVTYLDQCGNIGGISNKNSNMLLEGSASSTQHLLTWNGYQKWADGVKNYQIQRFNQIDKEFELITQETNTNKTSFSSKQEVSVDEAIKSEYCYRIQANLNNSLDTVLSNTLCFTAELKEHFPTAFTPNNDDINDVFEFVGAHAKSLNVAIYSKWGQAVFSSDKVDFQWDGINENSGKLCQQGVYIVKYEVVDFDNVKTSNHVNLMLIRN
ncbi:MAG: gliding motility-associated C-terminal domain-containing protein [Flavobacteriales bacterium]|nr:gliding motility-associated C-terminal domain-containing protein [Flavobacteriales bacterium]